MPEKTSFTLNAATTARHFLCPATHGIESSEELSSTAHSCGSLDVFCEQQVGKPQNSKDVDSSSKDSRGSVTGFPVARRHKGDLG